MNAENGWLTGIEGNSNKTYLYWHRPKAFGLSQRKSANIGLFLSDGFLFFWKKNNTKNTKNKHSFQLLPSSAQAPAKLGWVAIFSANPTTPTHPHPHPGVHKIFFVWYPTCFPKNLSYEMRDCYYQKMRQKSRYKMEYIT